MFIFDPNGNCTVASIDRSRKTTMAAMLRRNCTCLWKHINSTSTLAASVTRCHCISSLINNKEIFNHAKCTNCAQLSARRLESLTTTRLHHSSATGRCRMREKAALSCQRLNNKTQTCVEPAQPNFSVLTSYRCRRLSSTSFLSKHSAVASSFVQLQAKGNGQFYHTSARFLGSTGDGSSSSSSDGGGKGSEDGDGENEDVKHAEEGSEEPAIHQQQPAPLMDALSPMNVPEVFPRVPVIAISRNPVFPRFVKMMEV